jgi:hypothetical protein
MFEGVLGLLFWVCVFVFGLLLLKRSCVGGIGNENSKRDSFCLFLRARARESERETDDVLLLFTFDGNRNDHDGGDDSDSNDEQQKREKPNRRRRKKGGRSESSIARGDSRVWIFWLWCVVLLAFLLRVLCFVVQFLFHSLVCCVCACVRMLMRVCSSFAILFVCVCLRV